MDKPQPNNFVRALIVGLVLSFLTLAFFNFFFRDPPYEISYSLLVLLTLIVLICLSELFDNLAFGQILTLKRKVIEAKEENTSLSKDNHQLREQLISIVTNVQQSQVNNTFNAPPEVWSKLLGVVPSADSAKKEEDELEEATASQQDAVTRPSENGRPVQQNPSARFRRYKAAEAIAIRKYFDSQLIPDSQRLMNAEFSSAFHDVDPLMNRRITFDGYVKSEFKERFVEAINSKTNSLIYADRLYVMLNKVWLYSQLKKSQAELVLLLVEMEEEVDRPNRIGSLIGYFQPAISNNLLRVETISISSVEIDFEIEGTRGTF